MVFFERTRTAMRLITVGAVVNSGDERGQEARVVVGADRMRSSAEPGELVARRETV